MKTKILRLSGEVIVGLLKDGPTRMRNVSLVSGHLPDDAEITGVDFDKRTDTVQLFIKSEHWEGTDMYVTPPVFRREDPA